MFLKECHQVSIMDRKRRIYAAAAIGLSGAIFFVVGTRESLFDATTDLEFCGAHHGCCAVGLIRSLCGRTRRSGPFQTGSIIRCRR
jgi:hypothetical protein